MKKILAVLLTCSGLCWVFSAQALDVVLAFTQVQSQSTSLDGTARSQMIINHLRRLDVGPVAVLVRTSEIKPRQQARIGFYHDAGHLLINHGHQHHLLSRPDLYRYQVDLLAADARLRSYNNYRGHVLLANFENNEPVSNRQKLLSFAHDNQLTPIYISVKAQDGHLNTRYQNMVNKNRRVDMAPLQEAYIDMMWRELLRSDLLQRVAYGRAPLVLLLEENDLTAYFLPGLIDRIRDSGGRILAPQALFNQPAVYRMPVNAHTGAGLFSAVAGIEPPRLITPLLVGGDAFWIDHYLTQRGLLQ
jgi:hypothetical protein